jgi:hypothetical protein
MGTVETLRSRGNLSGWYVRPAGSDRYPPAVGTRVPWVLSQPVADLLAQGKRLGWTNKGTIGNTAHLRRHGDHTGHSLGKMRGVVYGKDTELSAPAGMALLQLCRMNDYDTRWIDFFNYRGRQYNFAGVDTGPSDDVHFHASVRQGHELTRVTLFDDMQAVMSGTFRNRPLVPMPAIFSRLGFIEGASLVQLAGQDEIWLAGRGKRAHVKDMNELNAIRAYLRSRLMSDRINTVEVLSGTVVP